jgi:alpha-tubulin suppressor-like RCC1 family protein
VLDCRYMATPTNALIAWGNSPGGSLGGGYYTTQGAGFSFPQGVISVANVAQPATSQEFAGALLKDGTVRLWGQDNEGQLGQGNQEANEGDVAVFSTQPVAVKGGIPLYPEEVLYSKKLERSFTQPVGPIGPVLPPIKQLLLHGSRSYFLTTDGRALACGAGQLGELANGYERKNVFAIEDEEQNAWFPQLAPWWVQTEGPPQREAPGGTNILKGIKQISAGYQCAHFLANGTVYLAGNIAAFRDAAGNQVNNLLYATPDPLLAGKNLKIVAISGGHRAYLVLLDDGTVRVVGTNKEGIWGNGSTEEKSSVRAIANPGLTDVVAISKAEFSWKALKKDGTVWTCGSNLESQQGLGLSTGQIVRVPTQIPGLTSVVAIASMGDERGTGSRGGELWAALLKDGTIRTGGNQEYRTLATEHSNSTGALGDGKSSDVPGIAQPKVSGVSAISVSPTQMVHTVEGAIPAQPTLTAVSPSPGVVEVKWKATEGTPWRAPEGWTCRVSGPVNKTSNKLGPNIHSFTATGLTPGVYQAKVIESQTRFKAVPVGGEQQTAVNKKLHLKWTAPAKAEPGLFVEWQRIETYTDSKGVAGQLEEWNRSAELSGGATEFDLELTPRATHSGAVLTGETVRAIIVGAFEGSFQTRAVDVVVR